jgi:hypothetical protein
MDFSNENDKAELKDNQINELKQNIEQGIIDNGIILSEEDIISIIVKNNEIEEFRLVKQKLRDPKLVLYEFNYE